METQNENTLKVTIAIYCNNGDPKHLGFILENDKITNQMIRKAGNMAIAAIAQQVCPPPDNIFKPSWV